MGGGGKGEFFDLDERRGGGDLMVDHDIVREVRRGDTPRRRNRTVEANGGIKKPVVSDDNGTSYGGIQRKHQRN